MSNVCARQQKYLQGHEHIKTIIFKKSIKTRVERVNDKTIEWEVKMDYKPKETKGETKYIIGK